MIEFPGDEFLFQLKPLSDKNEISALSSAYLSNFNRIHLNKHFFLFGTDFIVILPR